MKKLVPFSSSGSVVKKKAVPVSSFSVKTNHNIGLSLADCICATMKPHCPVHSTFNKQIPAPGCDVIR